MKILVEQLRDFPCGDRPHLRIGRHVAKGGRRRTVPLWWDQGTLADLAAWRAERAAQGATQNALFVADLRAGKLKAAGALVGQAKKRNPNVDAARLRELCIELARTD